MRLACCCLLLLLVVVAVPCGVSWPRLLGVLVHSRALVVISTWSVSFAAVCARLGVSVTSGVCLGCTRCVVCMVWEWCGCVVDCAWWCRVCGLCAGVAAGYLLLFWFFVFVFVSVFGWFFCVVVLFFLLFCR